MDSEPVKEFTCNQTYYVAFLVHCRPHTSDSGTADISATSCSLDLSVMLGRGTLNRMTLKATGCSDEIGHLSVDFHGGARYMLLIIMPPNLIFFTQLVI